MKTPQIIPWPQEALNLYFLFRQSMTSRAEEILIAHHIDTIKKLPDFEDRKENNPLLKHATEVIEGYEAMHEKILSTLGKMGVLVNLQVTSDVRQVSFQNLDMILVANLDKDPLWWPTQFETYEECNKWIETKK